mmetsp:Transcript_23260/g.48833  ORF Transcript_23260/g.48833 Transcript_23260/m.48833 type:complete len:611 (+) Transcript_23260:183-2015(+)
MSHNLRGKSTPAGGRVLLAFSLAAVAIASSWQPVAESLSIPRSSGKSGRGPNGSFGSSLGNFDRSSIGGSVHSRKGRNDNGKDRGSIVMASSSQSQDVEGTNEAIIDAVTHNESPRELLSESTTSSLPSEGDEHTTTHAQITTEVKNEEEDISIWPQFDALDKRMIKIALPCIANFAINPLIGAVDLFWVNRMGNALAVAGQAAANQVFSSAFWVVSFLPSVTATLVSKANANGDQEDLQDAVSQALVVGFCVSLFGSALMLKFPEKVLSSVLKDGAPALQYAKPYLFIRSFAFLPSLVSLIGFSAFRGTLDTSTPLKISLASNIFNAILDPILMFTFAMGVPGAALATLAAEVISAGSFISLMLRRKMFRWSKIFRLPSWTKLKPLLKGGAALQLRNVALNLTFLAVARVTQSLDDTGVAAAAHALAIQVFQVGGIVLLALSTVAQTVVPNELIEKVDSVTGRRHGGQVAAKNVVNRLMSWGFLLGIGLGTLQMLLLPMLQKSSPLQAVRDAAVVPSILASVYQIMNGLVFIGEGVMVGCGNFMQLSLSTVVATIGALISLNTLPKMFGLTGVWMSFGVFNSLRLAGVWLHQTKIGPLANLDMAKGKSQ